MTPVSSSQLIIELFEALPVPTILVGASDVILFVNSLAQALFPGVAMPGMSWSEFQQAQEGQPAGAGSARNGLHGSLLVNDHGHAVRMSMLRASAPATLRPAGCAIVILTPVPAAHRSSVTEAA